MSIEEEKRSLRMEKELRSRVADLMESLKASIKVNAYGVAFTQAERIAHFLSVLEEIKSGRLSR